MSEDAGNLGHFEDPLENYDPKMYTDPLERAIAEAPVEHIRHQPLASIHPDASIAEAVRQLAGQQVACLLVEDEDGSLVGVFTDRDVLNHVVLESDMEKRTVREVMTDQPVYVYADDPAAATLCVMAVFGFRHVPVLDTDERIKGIVSPQRVTQFLMKHFK